MNLALDRQRAVATLFLVLTVGLSAYAVGATFNYLQYWPALGQLSAVVSSASLTGDNGSNQPKFFMLVQVSNPSGFSGFTIADYNIVTLILFVRDNSSIALFSGFGLAFDQTAQVPINANSQVTTHVPVPLSTDQSAALQQFNRTYISRGIIVFIYLQVGIISFLNAYTGHYQVRFRGNVTLSLS